MQSHCRSSRFHRPLAEFENILEHVFGGTTAEPSRKFSPAADIVELKDAFQVVLDLPGVSLDGINVEFVDDQLKISGERKSATAADTEKIRCHRTERIQGAFDRVFKFSTDVDADKIDAQLSDGVLTVTLPKAPQVLPRQIQINKGQSAESQN